MIQTLNRWYSNVYLVLSLSMQIIFVSNFHSWFHHTICPSLTWSYCQDSGGHTFDASGKTRILTGNRSKPAGGADTPPCAILSGRFLEFWAKFEQLGTFSPSCSAYNPHWNSFKGWFFGSHMAFTFSLGKPPPPPKKKRKKRGQLTQTCETHSSTPQSHRFGTFFLLLFFWGGGGGVGWKW